MGEWRWWTVGIVIAGGVLLGGVAANDGSAPLVQNSDFHSRQDANTPTGYSLTGAARYQYLGDPAKDMSGWGIALSSTGKTGSVSQVVSHLSGNVGRKFRFSVCGLPQDGFSVDQDSLALQVDFLGADGIHGYDSKTRPIYPLIQQARRDLTANGVHHVGGAAAWTTYSLDFEIPFAEVDQLRLSLHFENGNGRSGARDGSNADFYVSKFNLDRLAGAADDRATPESSTATKNVAGQTHLIALGGRWFYAAAEDESAAPQIFDHHNATRLLYHDDTYSAPFAGMMSSILRAGEKDLAGRVASQDQIVDDNVTVHFDRGAMVVHTRGLPNHPTGKFPESGFGRGFNPNFIIEQDQTFYLPINPQVNARHFVTDSTNANRALPMGPIGVAVNGIVFFNPFDMGNQDATDLMDRCCGHPNQDGLYHYHKYPICLNSPWSDRGEGHSPLIGFAFDGFPIYGPYESAGVMAKDESGEHALNGFNLHFDEARGLHYHVTPGKFPYIIGGYWGTEDARDDQRPKHPGGQMRPPPPRPF